MSKATTYTVMAGQDKAGQRLDRVLAQAVPDLSRSRIQALMGQGMVIDKAGDAVVNPAAKTMAGQTYTLTLPPPEPAMPQAQDIPLDVVYEDAHLIIIDKPVGMVVHPAAGHADGTLVNAVLHHCRGQLSGIGGVSRPGIVHRLDKDTSGLMVVAKDDITHRGLAEQFAAHTLERAYKAMVWGRPKSMAGSISGNIGRAPRNRKKMAVVSRGGKTAMTHFHVEKRYGEAAALVECRLETGRTHQIRVHMASIGHPVMGDLVYGGGIRRCPAFVDAETRRKLQNYTTQALHAYLLGFIHPMTGKVIRRESTKMININAICDILDSM